MVCAPVLFPASSRGSMSGTKGVVAESGCGAVLMPWTGLPEPPLPA